MISEKNPNHKKQETSMKKDIIQYELEDGTFVSVEVEDSGNASGAQRVSRGGRGRRSGTGTLHRCGGPNPSCGISSVAELPGNEHPG